MRENQDQDRHHDHVVFTARYSPFRTWGSLLLVPGFPLFLVLGGACFAFGKGDYLAAGGMGIMSMCLLAFVLDSLLFQEMTFYGDRVTKYWRLFGSRTVYYSSGAVASPHAAMRWQSSIHFIWQVRADDDDKAVRRLPLMYIAFCFPPDTAKVLSRIMDYLADDSTGSWRRFRRATLPGEALCHENW